MKILLYRILLAGFALGAFNLSSQAPVPAPPQAAPVLIELLRDAQSRAVRVWSVQLLRRHHVENLARTLTPLEILALLDHADEEVQQFAAELLERSPALPNLDVATWLLLLNTRNVAALEIITRLMAQHVRPERLTVPQMVDIAKNFPNAKYFLIVEPQGVKTLEQDSGVRPSSQPDDPCPHF